jgi:hypothetical protein
MKVAYSVGIGPTHRPFLVRVAEYADQRRSIQTTKTMITIRTMVPRPIYMVSSPKMTSAVQACSRQLPGRVLTNFSYSC